MDNRALQLALQVVKAHCLTPQTQIKIMKNSIYMDGISNITMVDGIVRFDLVTLAKIPQSPEKDAPPLVEAVASVATTLPGFLRIHEQMQGVVNNMAAQGLIKKNPAPDAAKIEAPAVTQ